MNDALLEALVELLEEVVCYDGDFSNDGDGAMPEPISNCDYEFDNAIAMMLVTARELHKTLAAKPEKSEADLRLLKVFTQGRSMCKK